MNADAARARRAFFALFTLSGFSGLIYESIWRRYSDRVTSVRANSLPEFLRGHLASMGR